MSFARNLKAVMNEKNLSQTDLSELTGIGKSSLSQYLSGKNAPHRQRVAQIAAALGVTPGRLTLSLQNEDDSPPEILTSQKVSIEVAAKRLGKSPQFVRLALQNGSAPFGFATRGTGSTYDYHISPKLLNEYIGNVS